MIKRTHNERTHYFFIITLFNINSVVIPLNVSQSIIMSFLRLKTHLGTPIIGDLVIFCITVYYIMCILVEPQTLKY